MVTHYILTMFMCIGHGNCDPLPMDRFKTEQACNDAIPDFQKQFPNVKDVKTTFHCLPKLESQYFAAK